jgi:hypothetical protein
LFFSACSANATAVGPLPMTMKSWLALAAVCQSAGLAKNAWVAMSSALADCWPGTG